MVIPKFGRFHPKKADFITDDASMMVFGMFICPFIQTRPFCGFLIRTRTLSPVLPWNPLKDRPSDTAAQAVGRPQGP
jgi:hypothetical protein